MKEETGGLFKKFLDSSGVDASFHIPSTLVDFFRTLSVKTKNDISLFDRGDGIQARFIPEILDEISKNSSKNIIWGFEEPENSYEAGNIRKLRDEFLRKYSRKKQIFITTHTKEFLSLKREFTDAEKKIQDDKKLDTKTKRDEAIRKLKPKNKSSAISIYRVWKNEETHDTSLITRFDESNSEWEKTCDDLGIIVQEARIIENLQEKLREQTREVSQSRLSEEKQKKITDELISEMQECLRDLKNVKEKIEEYEKPILYVEDKYDEIYKIALLKTKGIIFNKTDFLNKFKELSPFIIRRGESAGKLSGRLRSPNCDGYEDKKIIGLFDFDKEGRENIHHLKKDPFWENDFSGDIKSGFFKKRTDHKCFFALLLPIPDELSHLANLKWENFASYVAIENLLPSDFLIKNKLVTEIESPAGKYLKVKEDKKSKIWEKILDLPEVDFKNFKPLFDKIEELFGIE